MRDVELQKGDTVEFIIKKIKKNEGELKKIYIEEPWGYNRACNVECVRFEMQRRKPYIKDPFWTPILLCGEYGRGRAWQTFLSPLKGQCLYQALIGLSQTTSFTVGFYYCEIILTILKIRVITKEKAFEVITNDRETEKRNNKIKNGGCGYKKLLLY